MSDFTGILDTQVKALRESLRQEQESRCRELVGEAKARAMSLLRESRQQLRERGRQAVDEERGRREEALTMARHRIRTLESQEIQARYSDLVGQAWPALVAELERRWSTADSRRAWCETLLGEARAMLVSGSWAIEHPVDWSANDTKWFLAKIQDCELPKPSLRADPECGAGLRITIGSACLDGTIQGLLTRRSRIEGRLLAAWERQARVRHE